jgi:hypothetical protein
MQAQGAFFVIVYQILVDKVLESLLFLMNKR